MDSMVEAEAFFERRRDLMSKEMFDRKAFVRAGVRCKLCASLCVIQTTHINAIDVFMFFVCQVNSPEL